MLRRYLHCNEIRKLVQTTVSQKYIAQEYYRWDKASIKYAIYIKFKDRW